MMRGPGVRQPWVCCLRWCLDQVTHDEVHKLIKQLSQHATLEREKLCFEDCAGSSANQFRIQMANPASSLKSKPALVYLGGGVVHPNSSPAELI